MYLCRASNNIGAELSVVINITVHYGPVYVVFRPTETSHTVVEGGVLGPIECTAECKPDCDFKWHGPNVVVEEVSELYVTNILRNESGDYRCTASNTIGSSQSDTVKVDVIYPVKEVTLQPFGLNGILNVISGEDITLTCTTSPSHPLASIQWYIGERNVTKDAIPQNHAFPDTSLISSSKLNYVGKGEDDNKTVYCEAYNTEEFPKIRSTYKTVHIGYLPEKVKDIRVVCVETVLVVTWQSESDRGNQQFFIVEVQNLQTGILTHADNVSDPGIGSVVQYTTQLSLNEFYLITIKSVNIYGTVRSDEVRYCNTTGLATTVDRKEPLSFSAGFGSGAALIVFINIIAIIVVLVIKRRSRIPERSKVYERTKQGPSDINLYNELDETLSGSKRSVQDYGNVAYEEITSTVDQTSSAKPREK